MTSSPGRTHRAPPEIKCRGGQNEDTSNDRVGDRSARRLRAFENSGYHGGTGAATLTLDLKPDGTWAQTIGG
jgi:hypothetical protein